MAEGGKTYNSDSDDDADFEKVEHSDPVVTSGLHSLYVTHTKTYFSKYFDIRKAKNVIFNQGCTKENEQDVVFTEFICGKAITFEKGGTCATRTGRGFQDGLCFVNDIISEEKPVHFRITETFEGTNGRCRLGFTKRDPWLLQESAILNKDLECAKTSNDFFITEPFIDTCAYPGAVIYYSYSEGQVVFGSSKDAKQIFSFENLSKDDTKLWALIELQGCVSSVDVLNNEFHEVCGTNITITGNSACRNDYSGPKGGFTCFSKEPFKPGQAVEFKLKNVSITHSGNVRTGVSTENPSLITPSQLPRSIIQDKRFHTMDLGVRDSVCGNIVSIVPIDNHVCVIVSNDKEQRQIGVINIDKRLKSKWAVIELFGSTKAVQLLSSLPSSQPNIIHINDCPLEMHRNIDTDELVKAVQTLWLFSQVLINTFKDVAAAIAVNLESYTPVSYWNTFLDTFASTAAPAGITEYVQMVEWGDSPQVIRREGLSLLHSVEQVQARIAAIKSKAMKIQGGDASSHEMKQMCLLQIVAKDLPEFDIKKPKRKPEIPSPSPVILNLSALPTDVDSLDQWNRQCVRKALLDTANKIGASLKPVEGGIRELYALGI